MIVYGSVCSGIEAASVAWHPLGWRPAFFSEIARFPRAVLSHRWPGVPLHGDFTTIQKDTYPPIALLVGGTPCQSFSLAGLRGGLADDRGNLALEFFRLADRLRPRWLVWENVPGVLSSGGGRDFGSILGAMEKLGYGWAYRTLDAQYVRVDGLERAVPQRRRRVFVVGYSGNVGRSGNAPSASDLQRFHCVSAAVLLEPESLSGNPAPRRKAGAGVARSLTGSAGGASAKEQQYTFVGAGGDPLNALDDFGGGLFGAVAHTLRAEGADAMEDGTGRGVPIVTFSCKDDGRDATDDGAAPTLRSMNDAGGHANGGGQVAVASAAGARKLTPLECERLNGLPDDYTRVPVKTYKAKPRTKHFIQFGYLYARNPNGTWTRYAADAPRYKANGNTMAVNAMRWLGRRIDTVDAILHGDLRTMNAVHRDAGAA